MQPRKDAQVPRSQRLDEVDEYQILDTNAEPPRSDEVEDLATEAPDSETPSETWADAYTGEAHDTGELYGVHTPDAADPDLDKTPDRESFVDAASGEHWLETLGKKAAEYGAEAEQELDVVDNSDELGGHHSSESGDRPVADKGSGGEAGL
jgi:hypothetical protein